MTQHDTVEREAIAAFLAPFLDQRTGRSAGSRSYARHTALRTLLSTGQPGPTWRAHLERAEALALADGGRAVAAEIRALLDGSAVAWAASQAIPGVLYRCPGAGRYGRSPVCEDRGCVVDGSDIGHKADPRTARIDAIGATVTDRTVREYAAERYGAEVARWIVDRDADRVHLWIVRRQGACSACRSWATIERRRLSAD